MRQTTIQMVNWPLNLSIDHYIWHYASMKTPAHQSIARCPINKILGTEANVRVLRELLRHGGALGVSRLAGDAGLSRQGARNAANALSSAGVIEQLGAGNTILYRVDMQHPLAPALKALFDGEEARVQAILQSVRAAVQAPEIIGAWIYGSFARGEDDLASDLDIAVLTGQRDLVVIESVREQLYPAADKLRFSPSVIGIDLSDVDRLRRGDPWWSTLVREALVVKGGRPDSLA